MMLQMLMQPRQVALHDEPQRFCVVFQPYDNLAVSFPAHDGSDGSVGAPRPASQTGYEGPLSLLRLRALGGTAARPRYR